MLLAEVDDECVSASASAAGLTVRSLIDVRSPAPLLAALVGLLGIAFDEQVLPALRRVLARERIGIEWIKTGCVPLILGRPPQPEKREMET